jgi:hypothetical protein
MRGIPDSEARRTSRMPNKKQHDKQIFFVSFARKSITRQGRTEGGWRERGAATHQRIQQAGDVSLTNSSLSALPPTHSQPVNTEQQVGVIVFFSFFSVFTR